MRLFLWRVLLTLFLVAVALVTWAFTFLLIFTIQRQSEEVRHYYGWIP